MRDDTILNAQLPPQAEGTVLNAQLPPQAEGTVLNPALRYQAEGTILNSQLPPQEDATVLNPALNRAGVSAAEAEEVTVLNPVLPIDAALTPGTLVNGRYEIIRRMEGSAGEADLFLCRDRRQPDAPHDFVFKLYHRPQALKKEVALALQAVSTQTVAKIDGLGKWRGRTYEVTRCYPGGSLAGRQVDADTLRSRVIPQLAEALHTLHELHILHKDLKPSNIMLRTEEGDIALIDFGISSMQQEGSTVLVTQTGLTPHYAAPETFRGLFLEESDYYAMGVTICALYQGHSPYHGMTQEQVMQLVALQKLPIPPEMPDDLRDLITGLTYPDITSRNDQDNPNRRWKHDEVMRWLRGEKQPVPGGRQVTFLAPLPFAGKQYSALSELTEALIAQWDAGRQALTSGTLAAAFRKSLPGVAPLCARAQNAAKSGGGQEDIAYFHLLYALMDDTQRFVWQGEVYESTTSLGITMLDELQSGGTRHKRAWTSMLKHRALSAYISLNRLTDTPQAVAVRALEDAFADCPRDAGHQQLIFFQTAYLLSGQRRLALGEQVFYTPAELAAHMQQLGETDFARLQKFCHSLMTIDYALQPQLEAWLIACGHQDQLTAWRGRFAPRA